jgi:hypothetical protein
MLKLLVVIICVINSCLLYAFEGNVQLTRQSQYDTTYFVFYLKDSNVRVDEFSATGQLNKTLLVNLETEKIVALSPALKVYANLQQKSQNQSHSKFDVIKTENYKIIEGKKCYQWRVRNRELECEITYWVMESDNLIVRQLYRILDLTENYSSIPSYFKQIPQNSGFIPLIAIERNLVREKKQTIQITSINERKVPSKLFEIPGNYKNLRI